MRVNIQSFWRECKEDDAVTDTEGEIGGRRTEGERERMKRLHMHPYSPFIRSLLRRRETDKR